jgi:2-dehydropantoate 2-reductase
MRYVIYGAGAIGGVTGARLHQHGHDTILIARGAHLDAMRARGLTLESPTGTETFPIDAVARPSEIDWQTGDVVLLCMKTQDTAAALIALRDASDADLPVFCVQNGVENERLAARLFPRAYGVMVFMPATHLEPGVVRSNGSPVDGILTLGCYPSGTDHLVMSVAQDLEASNISAPVVPDVMRWKYAKLLNNLGNAVQAACGFEGDLADLYGQVRDEAVACYRAAGIEWASAEEMRAARGDFTLKPAGDEKRAGGSSWQSLARGQGSIETDYLNGEIALLGAMHGVATPANRAVQRAANRLALERMPPGSITPDQLRAEIARE